MKERGPILGNAVIVDDYKDYTIDDIRVIVEIADIIPGTEYVPDPIIEKMSVCVSKIKNDDYSRGRLEYFNDVIRENSSSKYERKKIWAKIGKYIH